MLCFDLPMRAYGYMFWKENFEVAIVDRPIRHCDTKRGVPIFSIHDHSQACSIADFRQLRMQEDNGKKYNDQKDVMRG
jgi:hypothetical protein